MRALGVTVGVAVVLPGAASAQLAPRDQAQFEQRFTGWALVSDAPDCNEGNGIDPIRFIGPGRFETGGLEGSYEYQGTGADTETLTLTVDLLPIPRQSVLTFDSRTTGTFTAAAGRRGGLRRRLRVRRFDDARHDAPTLVGAEVTAGGDEVTLAFDEDLTGVDSLWVRLFSVEGYLAHL